MSVKLTIEIPAFYRSEDVYVNDDDATVNDVLQEVIELNQLEDATEFLGLTFIDRCGRCVWASFESRVHHIDFHVHHNLKFTLSVRKFPNDYNYKEISPLATDILFHYVSTCSSMHQLPIDYKHDLIKWMAAYKAKVLNVNVTSLGFSLRSGLLPLKFATDKNAVIESEQSIIGYYRDLDGQSEFDAMVHCLNAAYACECYNQTFFRMRSRDARPVNERRSALWACDVLLGVGPAGITEYSRVGSSGGFKAVDGTIRWHQVAQVARFGLEPLSANCADFVIHCLKNGELRTNAYFCYRKDGEAFIELASSYLPDEVFKIRPGVSSVKGDRVWPFWEYFGKHHAPDCNCFLSSEEICYREENVKSILAAHVKPVSGMYSLASIETFRRQLYATYCRLFMQPKPFVALNDSGRAEAEPEEQSFKQGVEVRGRRASESSSDGCLLLVLPVSRDCSMTEECVLLHSPPNNGISRALRDPAKQKTQAFINKYEEPKCRKQNVNVTCPGITDYEETIVEQTPIHPTGFRMKQMASNLHRGCGSYQVSSLWNKTSNEFKRKHGWLDFSDGLTNVSSHASPQRPSRSETCSPHFEYQEMNYKVGVNSGNSTDSISETASTSFRTDGDRKSFDCNDPGRVTLVGKGKRNGVWRKMKSLFIRLKN